MNKRKRITIFADCPPPLTAESLAEYAALGLDTYALTENYIRFEDGRKEYEDALRLLRDAGLDVFIRGLNHEVFPGYFDKFRDFDFKKFPWVTGFYMIDEPNASMFPEIADVYVPYFNENYADLHWHVNLLPSRDEHTAPATDAERLCVADGGGKTAFENYVDRYVSEVLDKVKGSKDIGTDHYPYFLWKGDRSMSDIILSDYAVLAETAKRTGAELCLCIQTFGESADGWRQPESAAAVRFQLYLAMAFGAHMFEIFLYKHHPRYNLPYGIVEDGKKTALYEYTQSAIREIRALEKEYLTFRWQGLLTVKGEAAEGAAVSRLNWRQRLTDKSETRENAEAFDRIADKTLKGIEGLTLTAAGNTLVGAFEGTGGKRAALILNYSDPVHNVSDRVTAAFDKPRTVAYYENGVKKTAEGARFTFGLEPGGAVFLLYNQ
ncbi:hypothetical protein FACS1894211_16030 [Clostridia bacterium]|nr:hypothetical protein FACS1894211_16030 [Clostridia bacterium]